MLNRDPGDVAVYLHEHRLDEDEPGRVSVELAYLEGEGRTSELIHEVGEVVVSILDEAIKSVEDNEGHKDIERIAFLGVSHDRGSYVRLRRE